jgi:hypothetical protein
MFKNISDWQTDKELEASGVPVDLGKGRAIFVKRAGGSNREYKVAVGETLREVMGSRDPADVPDEEIDPVLVKLYADHIVVGWRGFIDENDQEIPYTREAFIELMSIAPDMWVTVRTHAKERESFSLAALENDKTQLGKSLRGRTNGEVSAHA